MAKQLSHSTCNAKMIGYANGGPVLSDSLPIGAQLGGASEIAGKRTVGAGHSENDMGIIHPAPATLDQGMELKGSDPSRRKI